MKMHEITLDEQATRRNWKSIDVQVMTRIKDGKLFAQTELEVSHNNRTNVRVYRHVISTSDAGKRVEQMIENMLSEGMIKPAWNIIRPGEVITRYRTTRS